MEYVQKQGMSWTSHEKRERMVSDDVIKCEMELENQMEWGS